MRKAHVETSNGFTMCASLVRSRGGRGPGMTIEPRSSEHLVYSIQTTGHRQSYLDILGDLFQLEAITGKPSLKVFGRLIKARRLLFAGLDESTLFFVICAVIRSILRRPTVGLFLRAQKCFETTRWYYPSKRRFHRMLRRLPGIAVATITPFDVMPCYAEVANVGVCDPQYWDMSREESVQSPASTALSIGIEKEAGQLPVLCILGGLGSGKGLAFLANTLEADPCLGELIRIVCAGKAAPGEAEIVNRLKVAGANYCRQVPYGRRT